jgi:short-subunit dehydrogenase
LERGKTDVATLESHFEEEAGMARNLRGAIVVVTGASSGIGRAAALGFAAQGANLVLAARGREALKEVAAQCRNRDVNTLSVPTDISAEDQVGVLAARALEQFGHIDVWVNCAAVVSFGRFLDVPAEAFRRIMETNVLGTAHGSRAALRHFQERGEGVLINVTSVLGKEGISFLSPYVASKEAIVGLSSCLREEFHGTQIHICTVLPASIDTPIWQHGANYTGRAVRPILPVYKPEQVAKTIVACAQRPRRIVYVGLAGPVITTAHKIAPDLFEEVSSRLISPILFQDSISAQLSNGNLFQPSKQPMSADGGWGAHGQLLDSLGVLGIAAGMAGVAGWVWARRRRIRRLRKLWRAARWAARLAA